MAVDKSPPWFARLREALSQRLHRLSWKSALLLIGLAGLLFWLRFSVNAVDATAWLGQRLPPFLRFIVQPRTIEFLVAPFLLGWALRRLWEAKYRTMNYVDFDEPEPSRTRSAPPESVSPYQGAELPEAAFPETAEESPELVLSESEPMASSGCMGEEPEFAVVRVFYATDREATGQDLPSRFYGKKQSADGKLSVGACEVSIPRDHRIGELEHPSFWRLELRENPEKHVVLLEVEPQFENAFWADVRNRVGGSRRKEAFVFVHGYNTTFEDAARRTAQLAYDLKFEGAAIFYSWPSYGELADYAKDENNVYWTVPHLRNFLAALAAQTGVKTIHLIAHSMGNRAVSYALQLLAREVGHTSCRMHHVVLTAPDIDANTFKDLAKDVKSVSDRVTLYVSPSDKALVLSKRFHGNPRLGETILVIPGIDTIDASSVDTSLIGHGYYAENTSVLTDIFYLLKDNKAPGDRFGMSPVNRPDGTYYEFQPTNR